MIPYKPASMADPHSITASVSGLVSLGIQPVQSLNQYAGSALDAKDRIKAISTDVDLTAQAAQTLATTIQDEANRAMMKDDAARFIRYTIAQCRNIFTKIQSTLPENSAMGPRERDVITWPFTESELDLFRGNLEKLKATLQLLTNVIVLAAMSQKHADQAVLHQQRSEIERLLRQKASAGTRLERLERDYRQTLAAASPASSSSDRSHIPSGTQQPGFVGIAEGEQSSGHEHNDLRQAPAADRQGILPENHTHNESLMIDLYSDYTACLQQIKMLQTSLKSALNVMFDPANGFPTVNSRLTSHDRQVLARDVDKSARQTLQCLYQRILYESPSTKVTKHHNPPHLDRLYDIDSFLSRRRDQNWPPPDYQNERLQLEEQHSTSDDSILEPDGWTIIASPDQISSSTFQRNDKQSLFRGPLEVYYCNVCSCRFGRWEHLKRHHNTHYTCDKPFDEQMSSRASDLIQYQYSRNDSVAMPSKAQHDSQAPSTIYTVSAPIPIQAHATRSFVTPLESVDDFLHRWTHLHS